MFFELSPVLLAIDPITLAIILGSIGSACGLGGLFAWGGYKTYQKSYAKVSDSEILSLVQRLGTLTSSRLANNSILTKNEAYWRLAMLYSKGALKVLYDEYYTTGYYALKETINFELKLPQNQTISEENMIWLAQQYQGRMSAAILVAATNLTVDEAKREIARFKDMGILSTQYDDSWQTVYVLNKDLPIKIDTTAKAPTQEIQMPVNQSFVKIIDAEVIGLAVKGKGKITVASLCLKKTISVEEAQKILDELYKKGIFDLKVTDNGTIEYWLNDMSLLEE